MKKHLFAGVALVALLVGPAAAADLSVFKAAPAAPVFSWTGFYAGGSVGGRWADTTWTTELIGSPAGPPDPSTMPASLNSSALRLGGYLGYNWQVAPLWVVGVEADVAWGRNDKIIGGIPGTFGPGGQGVGPGAADIDSSNVRLGWDGSIRARAGFLVAPTWLVYVAGGLAWQQAHINATCFGSAANASWCAAVRDETFSTTRLGWTIGVGAEAAIWGNWLVRAEYRFADYGNVSHTFFAGSGGDEVYMRESLRTHTASIGLAYKFGAGAAPMADFPVKARLYKAPPAAPAYAWTGLYAGGSLGGRWADTTWNTLAISTPVGPPDPSSTPASFDSATVRVGGYVGYNWQVAPLWVVGAEADVAWGRNDKSQAGIPGTFGPGGQGVGPGAVAFDTSNVRLGWDGSVRGRVGFLVAPTWLVYGTAGFAWQQVDINASCQGTPVNPS